MRLLAGARGWAPGWSGRGRDVTRKLPVARQDHHNEQWRHSLRTRPSAEGRAALPECPAGRPLDELDEASLADVVGGFPGPDQHRCRTRCELV
ncbi:mersacidin/lichenicidin family type 2 lantibiotic [Hyalangium gracile]|uniref:mersacidin/lichenicidin family type 2 lantibiotic n=1 Tax=Hyalangium gracile TaxID=394092 RepID=UPI001CC952BC